MLLINKSRLLQDNPQPKMHLGQMSRKTDFQVPYIRVVVICLGWRIFVRVMTYVRVDISPPHQLQGVTTTLLRDGPVGLHLTMPVLALHRGLCP